VPWLQDVRRILLVGGKAELAITNDRNAVEPNDRVALQDTLRKATE
jgi:hypothetical protein